MSVSTFTHNTLQLRLKRISMLNASSWDLHLSFPFCWWPEVSVIAMLMLQLTSVGNRQACYSLSLQFCTEVWSFDTWQPSSHGSVSSIWMFFLSSEDHKTFSDHRVVDHVCKTTSISLTLISQNLAIYTLDSGLLVVTGPPLIASEQICHFFWPSSEESSPINRWIL